MALGWRRDGADEEARQNRVRDFAWRVHAAQEAWTAKVDAKASIVFALQGAVLVTVVAASAGDGAFAEVEGWRFVLLVLGATCTLASAVFAGTVIFPLLGSSAAHARDHRDNLVYFGHLRHWADPRDLARVLAGMSPEQEVQHLARQMIEMSRRNWVKHRRLQASVVLGLCGVALVVVPGVWP